MRESTGWKRGVRSNALWGSGSRGESRKNALWGSGGRDGRRFAMAALAGLALVVPLSASADNGGGKGTGNGTYVSPGLLEHAGTKPNQKLHVIIQSSDGVSGAVESVNGLGADIRRRLQSAGAVAVEELAEGIRLISGRRCHSFNLGLDVCVLYRDIFGLGELTQYQ